MIPKLIAGVRATESRDPAPAVRRPLLLLMLIAAMGILFCDTLRAQMAAAPSRLMLTQRERSAEVVLYNPSADILEVSTGLGYTVQYSDSLGNSGLRQPTTAQEERGRCDTWVQVYPSRFSIAPNSSRTVRVLILPPTDLEEGEYWGRLRLTSTPTTFGLSAPHDTITGIETRIRTRVILDLPIIFRIGSVTTALELDNAVVRRNVQGGLDVFIRTVRTGNAAYRGTMYGELLRADGTSVAQRSAQFTTEFFFWRSLSFPSIFPGNYVLRVRAVAEKKGSAMDAVISAPTVETNYGIRITDTDATLMPAP